jgi:hypothetical protein
MRQKMHKLIKWLENSAWHARSKKPEALKANGGLCYKVGDIELHIGVEKRGGYNSKSHPAFEVENIEEVRRY